MAISRKGWSQSEQAIIARGDDFPDALCGVTLAVKYGAPILLTESNRLNSDTADEISRLKAKKITLLGGEGAISSEVVKNLQEQVKITTPNIERIDGYDRYETASLIARKININEQKLPVKTIIIATGENFPDALSVASFAAVKKTPILLVNRSGIPTATRETLQILKISRALIIGSADIIPSFIPQWLDSNGYPAFRIGGLDRYETNIETTEYSLFMGLKSENIFLATGEDFPDALVAGALAAKSDSGSPLLLTRNSFISPVSTLWFFYDLSEKIKNIFILGEEDVVSERTKNQIEKALTYSTLYPVSFCEFLDTPITFDANRIPLYNFADSIGLQYSPMYISQYALANFNAYEITKEQVFIENFLRQADWLVSHQTISSNGSGVWIFSFSNLDYNANPPWISSMAQSQAISTLVRAYQYTQDGKYLETAKKALKAFKFLIDEGGVISKENSDIFYEEIAVNPPAHILNGFIFSLWGPYDLWQATKDTEAQQIYNQGIETLKKNLSRYSLGDGSKYDLKDYPGKNPPYNKADYDYHQLHIKQLRTLYKQTEYQIFYDYFARWNGW